MNPYSDDAGLTRLDDFLEVKVFRFASGRSAVKRDGDGFKPLEVFATLAELLFSQLEGRIPGVRNVEYLFEFFSEIDISKVSNRSVDHRPRHRLLLRCAGLKQR
jgi:hypothetical protein